MNIIKVKITVPCYTFNMTAFKLILKPGNNGLGNRFQYTAIISGRSSLFIREYKVFKKQDEEGYPIQEQNTKII